MKRGILLIAAIVLLLPLQATKKTKQIQQTDREYWCSLAYQMAQPVLENMAKGEQQSEGQVLGDSQAPVPPGISKDFRF